MKCECGLRVSWLWLTGASFVNAVSSSNMKSTAALNFLEASSTRHEEIKDVSLVGHEFNHMAGSAGCHLADNEQICAG